jgi:hypothetical protein
MIITPKGMSPTGSAWRTSVDGDTYVTTWNLNLLIEEDLWEEKEPMVYFPYHIDRGRTLYMAQDPDCGYSQYYLQDLKNRTGFGGRKIPINLFDGSEIILEGPWSSNSAYVNQCIARDAFEGNPQFLPVREVAIYSDNYRRVGMASNLDVRLLSACLTQFLPQWHLALSLQGEEWDHYYELHAPEITRCEARVIYES